MLVDVLHIAFVCFCSESVAVSSQSKRQKRCGLSGIRRLCGLLAVLGKEKCIGNAGKREGECKAGAACKVNT